MYNRLFTKILDSSIWLEADATRIVWITLLAAMDEDGYAHFSCNENLAHRANVPVEALESALKILESPDKFNPDDEFQGRRIERVTGGGWLVLKAPYYRTLLTREIAREKTRLRVQKHRLNLNVTNETLQDVTVTKCNTSEQSIAEAKAKEDKENARKRAHPLSQKEVEDFCTSIDLKPSDGEAMWLRWQAQGYGKTRDWKATIRQWKIQGYHPSQKQSQPSTHPKQPAPLYDKLPPTREVSDDEFLKHQRIAKEAADKFRTEQARLRSA